jgi:predicted Zn-dependent peptidase
MDRLVQPEIKPLDSCNLAEPDIFYLKNGVRVVQFNAGTQELVRIELIFKAGSWYQSKNFVSMAANLMLREGTSKYNSQQIADTLDYYGAHL